MDSRELIGAKREEILRLAARHGAYNVRVFGSLARGKPDPRAISISLWMFALSIRRGFQRASWLILRFCWGTGWTWSPSVRCTGTSATASRVRPYCYEGRPLGHRPR
jgi:hypothetical protein